MTDPGQPRRILVVGGTGGTGAAVVRLLAPEHHAVRVLARRPGEARDRLADGVEVVAGDLRDPASLAAAVAGTDTIVHTAGVRGLLRSRHHEEIVVDGTVNLLRVARHEGLSTIVFMSSMGVASPSALSTALNLAKGRALVHKQHAEHLVRSSTMDFLILRAAILTDHGSHRDRLLLSKDPLPLRLGTRVSRVDVASFIVEALRLPCLGRTTADLRWDDGPSAGRSAMEALLPPVASGARAS